MSDNMIPVITPPAGRAVKYLDIFTAVLAGHRLRYLGEAPEAVVSCTGCHWSHSATQKAVAERLHAVHVVAVLRENDVTVEEMSGAIAELDAFGHDDRWADTGDGYYLIGRKYVIRCAWCAKLFAGDTRSDAEKEYQRHADDLADVESAVKQWVQSGGDGIPRAVRTVALPQYKSLTTAAV